MPAHPQVNNQKSDKLPAHSLLHERRVEIVRNWELLRDALPVPFDGHAEKLLGRKPGGAQAWQSDLFAALRQSVELTAVQRGIYPCLVALAAKFPLPPTIARQNSHQVAPKLVDRIVQAAGLGLLARLTRRWVLAFAALPSNDESTSLCPDG